MRTSRTPATRLVDYSAPLKFDGVVALRKLVVAYVRGVKGMRRGAVTEADIVAWFRSTPPDFVRLRIAEEDGVGIRSVPRARGPRAYEATS